jgi:hypothetical protein
VPIGLPARSRQRSAATTPMQWMGCSEGDTVAVALRKWFAAQHGEPWEGTMEGLLSLVNAWAEPEAKRQRNWPSNPSMLSARITMMADHLGKVGIEKHRGKTKRSVTIKTKG